MPTPNRPLPQNQYSEQYMENSSYDTDFGVLTREILGYDGQNLQRQNASNLSLQLDYDGGSNPVYIGFAAPGTATSTAKWMIKKLTFDANNNVTKIEHANGLPNFDQIYDNRASLSYS